MTTTTRENATSQPAEELFRRAREAMFEMFRFPSSGADTVEAVTQRIIASQRQAAELIDAFAKGWVELAEQGMVQPERWREQLDRWAGALGRMDGPFDAEAALRAWREGGERSIETLRSMMAGAPALATDLPPGADLTAFLRSPGFGLGREYQNRLGELFEAWLEQQRLEGDYRGKLAEAWSEAFRALSERLTQRLTDGKPVQDPKELVDLWVEIADERFTQLFHTEAFSTLQSSMLNAAHRVRRLRRELTESVLRANDMPTRRDLDEAHRAIYALRKQVRCLTREVERLQGQEEGETR